MEQKEKKDPPCRYGVVRLEATGIPRSMQVTRSYGGHGVVVGGGRRAESRKPGPSAVCI